MSDLSPGHVRVVVSDLAAQEVGHDELEIDVRVVAKTGAAVGVVTLELERADGGLLPRFEPGAHIELIIEDVAPRQYSLCGDVENRAAWRLGVLREADGRGTSSHVHDRVREGQVVRVRGPRNNFRLHLSPRYLFIAGGIGITPLLPMIADVDRRGADWRLFYGGRTRSSMAFLAELAAYRQRVRLVPHDEEGFLDLEAILGQSRPDTLVYCCGPEPLIEAVESRMTNWRPGALNVERFAAKAATEPVRKGSFDVVLSLSGGRITVNEDITVLQAVSAAGVDVPSSCSEGICGTCETKVLGGKIDHRDSILSDEEHGANDCMMICVSRSLTPELILDL